MQKLSMDDLGRMSVEEFKQAAKLPIITVLDNVRSMNNVGSIFRTADAFLIQAIHLCGYTPRPPHRDIHKTALGATETVEWKYFEDINDSLKSLRDEGFGIYAVEQAKGSIALNQFNFAKEKKIALILGNEVEGVQQSVIDACDGCIEIPQLGTKHSLNISIAAGIVLWEAARANLQITDNR
ncbi:RNA methyltransferase [Arachidicoccus ginsenosidimutans]|uniref:RNA methyltransferase n=1 Tax=Arachidicoccus sp. BS20 TaxID=1850526 RepID=UPI0007F04E04|nr:RNA methyltransferase [Arachidicoccus sp. BS20]ANI90516.1 RNA methyltransferase [Arachidicoccus sp. BS20]